MLSCFIFFLSSVSTDTKIMSKWLLPDYIEDIPPNEVDVIESARRAAVDKMRSHGYQLVMPPLIEYLESLVSGIADDVEGLTFKLFDQLSGKTMGIRADMTIQAARIDSHILNKSDIVRLCYAGSVLHTMPKGLFSTREPLQIGAEMYGLSGLEGDLEIQAVMLDILSAVGVGRDRVHLVLGNQGVVRALMSAAGVKNNSKLMNDLYEALKNRDRPEISLICKRFDKKIKNALVDLPKLTGDSDALRGAKSLLPDLKVIDKALENLRVVEQTLKTKVGSISYDFVDLRGFKYHTGLVFSLYSVGNNDALGWGGRYDDLGRAFGRARPATGFTMDLRMLSKLSTSFIPKTRVYAPWLPADSLLQKTIEELRKAGTSVIVDYVGEVTKTVKPLDSTSRLVLVNGEWIVSENKK